MACITKKKYKDKAAGKIRESFVIDFYDQHGKRRLKTLAAGTTKKEARKILHDTLKEVEHGIFLPERRVPTFKELADQWLEHKKMNIREHTYEGYECHVRNNLKPFFGETKITRINYSSITKFTAHEDARGASVHHVRKSLVLLTGIMKYAVRQRLIESNPVQEVEKPKGRSRYRESEGMDILRPEEIRRFLDQVQEPKYKTLFTLAIMSGARQGEILGLQWSDIDWFNSQVIIKRTFQHGRFYEPKSSTSRRKIDLGPTVIAQLKKWKMACPQNRLDLVFPSDEGTPIDNNNLVRRHFEPAMRKAGLRKIRFHDLRHTFASLLIDQGEHPKYIQTQMGHSSINVTMDTYGHLMKTVNRESARKLDTAIFKQTGDFLETFEAEGKRKGGVSA
jgi:integrase